MLRKLYQAIGSLNLAFGCMALVMLFMAIGSFASGEQSGINDMALLAWLRLAPLRFSWWLWIVLALLVVLTINTIVCSFETIRSRYANRSLLRLLAPQLMHAGFLLIVLAHLLSASGSSKEGGRVVEGMTVTLPDNSQLQFTSISGEVGSYGMPTAYQSSIIHTVNNRRQSATISPNHPYFYNGYGLYLKQVEFSPRPSAVVELHREPGASAALAGALIFTAGNLMLLFLRRGQEA